MYVKIIIIIHYNVYNNEIHCNPGLHTIPLKALK